MSIYLQDGVSLLREWRGGQARDQETHKPDLVRGTEQGETESQGQYGEIVIVSYEVSSFVRVD